MAVARDFVEHIVSRDEAFREYIAADEALYDAALECLEDYEDECEIHFSTPEEFANALKERMKYIFVNQNGSYTIGYDPMQEIRLLSNHNQYWGDGGVCICISKI